MLPQAMTGSRPIYTPAQLHGFVEVESEERQIALEYLAEAWNTAEEDGIESRALAHASLFAALATLVRQHGEEIAQLGKGDIVGEAAIVNHSLRTASIVALTPLELIHFTDEAVRALCEEMPSFQSALEAVAVERFGAR